MQKRASEVEFFPYSSTLICYVEVYKNGEVRQAHCNRAEIEQAYNRAKNGETQLYAAWAGSYSSELFFIDDLNKLADAYGIERADSHAHDIEWEFSDLDDGKSRYARVDIRFKCGCEFHLGTIKKLALDLKKQLGWEITMSTGLSGYAGKYTLRVLRKTIR